MLAPSKAVQYRLLDFDIENRPLSYLGQDFTTADVTCIAWCWSDDLGSLSAQALGRVDQQTMLEEFVRAYDEADVVTGHYILKHDLGHINGALLENGMPGLKPKLVSDTKVHLRRLTGVPKSQEGLSTMLGIEAPKVGMSQSKWRSANRLEPEGIEYVLERCMGDVVQHIGMRAALVKANLLTVPWQRWTP